MRRFAGPLAFSICSHLLLVGAFFYFPGTESPRRGGFDSSVDGAPLRLSIAGPDRRFSKDLAGRADEEEWNVDLEPPRLVAAPPTRAEVSSPTAAPRPLPEMPASTPTLPNTSSPDRTDGLPTATTPGIQLVSGQGPSLPGESGIGKPTGSAMLPLPRSVQRVVYVLDRSVSMGPSGALDRARRELTEALRALPPQTHFQVLVYNRVLQPLVPSLTGMVPATPAHVALAIGSLEDLSAAGATDHPAALRRALALRPDVLFWMTDADDLRESDLPVLRRANQSGAILHVVELTRQTDDRSASTLTHLAQDHGGTHRRIHPGR